MTQTLLTSDIVLRESLRILHQKATFLGSVDRQYDDSFREGGARARDGSKPGSQLRIRLPNKFVIRTGRTMSSQDVTEQSVTLEVTSQAGVDMNFTSKELTLHIDDFSKNFVDPAMATISSYMESTALTALTKQVYNLVDQDATAVSLLAFGLGRQKLQDNLAPDDGQRSALLSTTHEVKLVDALKGLFHSASNVEQQYREGVMGRTQGFEFMSSTHVNDHTTGTAVKGDTLYNVNGATESGSTITVNTGTTTFLAGDVITIAGCNRVHPETKVSTGVAQQFVITADSGANATSLAISPAIVVSGALQNVSGYPTNGGAITKVGAGNAELLNGSLVYHRSAFTVATADLMMPDGVHFASRDVYDGVSMRIVRAFDINNDQMPCRLDILFGQVAQYAQLASRIHADG
jgi:P22 coat protein - gene protein 5